MGLRREWNRFWRASRGKQFWMFFRLNLAAVFAFVSTMIVAIVSTIWVPQNTITTGLTLVLGVVAFTVVFYKMYEWSDFLKPYEGDKDEW